MKVDTKANADKAGLKLIEVEQEIAAVETDCAKKIAAAKEEQKAKLESLNKAEKELREGLAEWYWANPNEREDGKKRVKLTHVTITEIERDKWAYPKNIVERAKALKLETMVKIKETFNKELAKTTCTADQVKALGIKIKKESTVYVEPA